MWLLLFVFCVALELFCLYRRTDGCGYERQIYPGDFIRVTSPNFGFGRKYPVSIFCRWTFTAPVGRTLSLTFSSFELEHHIHCDWDYVKIHQGQCVYGSKWNTYCGAAPPVNFQSDGNVFCLEFRSDIIENRRGFEAHVFLTSNSTIDEHSTITDAMTKMETTVGYGITSFYVSESAGIYQTGTLAESSIFYSDYIAPTATSPLEGTDLSTVTTESTGILSTVQPSLPSVTGESIDICSGASKIIVNESGFITSPNFGPNNVYNADKKCSITLEAPHGKQINLIFTDFEVEYNPTCSWDSLTIYNGTSKNSSKSVLCGNDIPDSVSSRDGMLLEFISDHIVFSKGFRVAYTLVEVDVPSKIDNTIDEHSTFTDAMTKMETTVGNGITSLYVSEPTGTYQTETLAESSIFYSDYIAPTATSPLEGTDSSTVTTESTEIVSTVQPSVPSVTGESIDICSGASKIIVNESGIITSPNFGPNKVYNADKNCSITLEAPHGKQINLIFTDFEVEYNPTCSWDSLTIYNGTSKNSSKSVLCGKDIPDSVSSRDGMLLEFISDHIVFSKGFRVTYTLVEVDVSSKIEMIDICSGDGQYKVLDTVEVVSPNFGSGKYPINMDCAIRLDASSHNQHLRLTFLEFDIESHNSCDWDYLEIFEGSDDKHSKLGKFCGQQIPTIMSVNHNSAFLHFRSDHIVPKIGFRILVKTIERTISLASPLFDQTTCPSFTTEYSTKTSTADISIVTVTKTFQAEYTTLDQSTPVTMEPSSMLQSQTTKSHSYTTMETNAPETTKVVDPFVVHKAVMGDIDEVEITAFGLELYSPNFGTGQVYPLNVEYTFLAKSVDGTKLSVSFDSFDIEYHPYCIYDSLQVYDGIDASAISLVKLCGSTIPKHLTSSGPAIFFVFRSDVVIRKSGFKATVAVVSSNLGPVSPTSIVLGLTPSHILATDHSTIQSNDNHPVDLLTTVAATTVAQMEMTSIVNASVAYETVVMGDIEDLTITDSVCYLYSPNFGEGEFYPLDVEYTFLARSNQGTPYYLCSDLTLSSQKAASRPYFVISQNDELTPSFDLESSKFSISQWRHNDVPITNARCNKFPTFWSCSNKS
ncbi:hypothetical protein ScPMuIL_005885 [Solemya velum]